LHVSSLSPSSTLIRAGAAPTTPTVVVRMSKIRCQQSPFGSASTAALPTSAGCRPRRGRP